VCIPQSVDVFTQDATSEIFDARDFFEKIKSGAYLSNVNCEIRNSLAVIDAKTRRLRVYDVNYASTVEGNLHLYETKDKRR
jgi:hypothetical protein